MNATAGQDPVSALIQERDELRNHCMRLQAVADALSHPPGHFYSPIVAPSDIHAVAATEQRAARPLPIGIELDAGRMFDTLQTLAKHYPRFAFHRDRPRPGDRFHYGNPFFSSHDAVVYFAFLLELKPRRVVEVGSGWSTRLLFDTRSRFLNDATDVTLIDPFLDQMPDLNGLTAAAYSCPLQHAPIGVFERLEPNDILFIDSSHVAKTGSDVNCYVFEILPRLRSGVLVHIHDILYPFEYPGEWVLKDRRSWNEAYLIRAFLQYNSKFEIVWWNNFAFYRMSAALKHLMPLCLENEGGSLWLRKIA